VQHLELRLFIDDVVERLDFAPESPHPEDRDRDGVRARDVCDVAPVSSANRDTNVVPAQSTMLLARSW